MFTVCFYYSVLIREYTLQWEKFRKVEGQICPLPPRRGEPSLSSCSELRASGRLLDNSVRFLLTLRLIVSFDTDGEVGEGAVHVWRTIENPGVSVYWPMRK
jgi:hypothetical protein